MEFHDPSRVQTLLEDEATDETVIMYTVPVGKQFHIVSSILFTDNGAIGFASIAVVTAADVHKQYLNQLSVKTEIGIIPADHYTPGWPMDLVAGEKIVLFSSVASLVAKGDLFGYEANA